MWNYIEQKSTELFKVLAPEMSEVEKLFSAVEKGDVNYINSYPGDVRSARNNNGSSVLHVALYLSLIHISEPTRPY